MSKQKRKAGYIKRNFNLSYRKYKKWKRFNDGGCWVCGWKPSFNKKTGKKHNELAIDHFHKLSNLKIRSVKVKGKWEAYNVEFSLLGYFLPEAIFWFRSGNRRKAVKSVKMRLKKIANRGLLCWACNSGLRKWLDDPAKLRNASIYLENHRDLFKELLWKH